MTNQAIEFYPRTSCPGCGSERFNDIYRLSYSDSRLSAFIEGFYQQRVDYSLLQSHNFEISKCDDCGLLFQRQVLNSAGQAALYGDWVDNRKSLEKKRNAKAKLYRQYANQLLAIGQLIKKPPGQIEILEFGMGWGYWSRMAKAFGYRVRGLELSPERAEHARELGVEVIHELPAPGSEFDFIYANQVFEHLEAPLQTLIELTQQLKPGGIVYIRVPDAAGVEKALTGNGWLETMDAIHPLEHINAFTRKSLCSMAERAGLKVIKPPLRIDITKLWGGLKREINDRWFTTHVFFTLK